MDNWADLQGNNVSEFLRNYRQALEAQRDANYKQLAQQRRNYRTAIMGSASRRGTLYSNFPERDKIRYDTETYLPAYTKNQQSYQSGLDALRKNAVDLWNTIQSYNEQIQDYNAL